MACLPCQFAAEDAGDAGWDAGAALSPLIGRDFGPPEPMLLSLLVTYMEFSCSHVVTAGSALALEIRLLAGKIAEVGTRSDPSGI